VSNTTLIWLILGVGLCSVELFLPTAFVALMMGISALFVALLSGFLAKLWLQVVVWLVFSIVLILLCRHFVRPQRRKSKIQDAVIGETLTEIPAGKTGRVLYEGNSWQARCDDHMINIAINEKVYVVRREGTTLVVMPENLLHR
jgi:membrane protein implicated in regulation of membrane protease activity